MFKDLLVAIVLGTLFGSGLTGGYLTYNKKQKDKIIPTPTPQITETPPTETPSQDIINDNLSLTLVSPENNSLFNKADITVNGTTTPKANIIINTPVDTYNSRADDQGNFSIVVKIEAGINDLEVTAIDSNDNQINSNVFVAYSTNTPSLFTKDNNETKDSTELAKERIQKIANPASVTNQNKALFGNITSIETNQITLDNNGITYYINTDKDTVYINEKGLKIKFDSLKTNQTILCLGKFNSTTNSLLSKRTIILNPKSIDKNYQVVVGKIADISKEASIITIIPSKNKDTQYQVKTEQKNLKIGDKIIASLIPDEKISKTFVALKIISPTQ